MALTAAIYICGGISGGHVNPGVTLGLASIGKISWLKVPHYLLSQFLGAFFGALITFMIYSDVIDKKYDGYHVVGENATAGIFGTFPDPQSHIGAVFLEQVSRQRFCIFVFRPGSDCSPNSLFTKVVASAFFLLLINAITDKKNTNCPRGLIPIAIGITDLSLMILTFSYNSGAPINPARDFSPR